MKELAFYCYPGAPCGKYREYTAEELKDPKKLESVFDLCRIYEALITADGWHFLIGHYGFRQLYEIDKKAAGSTRTRSRNMSCVSAKRSARWKKCGRKKMPVQR